jgi:hypothetical protein
VVAPHLRLVYSAALLTLARLKILTAPRITRADEPVPGGAIKRRVTQLVSVWLRSGRVTNSRVWNANKSDCSRLHPQPDMQVRQSPDRLPSGRKLPGKRARTRSRRAKARSTHGSPATSNVRTPPSVTESAAIPALASSNFEQPCLMAETHPAREVLWICLPKASRTGCVCLVCYGCGFS